MAVTVDEATRIKPLNIPVKATLLGQQSARPWCPEATESVCPRCWRDRGQGDRKVTDVMNYSPIVSQGNHGCRKPRSSREELKSQGEQGQKLWGYARRKQPAAAAKPRGEVLNRRQNSKALRTGLSNNDCTPRLPVLSRKY